jgi:lipopolysaccharide/colanic/teichoic acid biosynthesis glycosyltransferase
MKGLVRRFGRPTKGGSLSGLDVRSSSRATTPRTRTEPKQHAREVPPSLKRKSDGARSPGELPVLLRDTIEQLIASDSAASSGLNSGNGTHKSSEQSNRRAPSQVGFSIDPPWTLDGAKLNGSHTIRIPRWKRILDLTCVFVALPFWLPVTILLMLWVKVASSGPVFYRQRRVGYRGVQFMIFKFRTMHVNAETRTHEEYFAHLMRAECPMTKLDHVGDSRLIPGARFLRASGLDELPQIFNVLRGEMSLVGPRPCLPSEFERYENWQQQRVNAPPGLTGYWQVNGKNKTTFREMIMMDLFYARNMSIRVDLGVMAQTVPVLVRETREAWNRYRARRPSRLASHTQVMGQAPPVTESLNGSLEKA